MYEFHSWASATQFFFDEIGSLFIQPVGIMWLPVNLGWLVAEIVVCCCCSARVSTTLTAVWMLIKSSDRVTKGPLIRLVFWDSKVVLFESCYFKLVVQRRLGGKQNLSSIASLNTSHGMILKTCCLDFRNQIWVSFSLSFDVECEQLDWTTRNVIHVPANEDISMVITKPEKTTPISALFSERWTIDQSLT